MRYKSVIWRYYVDFSEYKEAKSNAVWSHVATDQKELLRMYHAYAWLSLSIYPHLLIESPVEKPSQEDLLLALALIEKQGLQLQPSAKRYADPQLRKDLGKIAKQKMMAARYYRELTVKGYFDQIELKNKTRASQEEKPIARRQ